MSREIEFRQWNTKCERFGYFIDGNADFLFDWGCDDPVMQYTGLKDSNDVEIYEGDLVRIIDTEEPYINLVGQVKYGVRSYPAFDIYDRGNGTLSDEYNTLTNSDLTFQVIGNIYENPELVERFL